MMIMMCRYREMFVAGYLQRGGLRPVGPCWTEGFEVEELVILLESGAGIWILVGAW